MIIQNLTNLKHNYKVLPKRFKKINRKTDKKYEDKARVIYQYSNNTRII